MKSGIAAMISAVSQLDQKTLEKGIKFYITYDEEIGFSGIKEVVEYEKKFPQKIIIGEPTNNEFIVGSKGLIEYKVSITGKKTHSSTPDKGINAIMKAIDFINELNKFYEELKLEKNNAFDVPYTTMNIGKISGGTEINSVPDYCEFAIDYRTINREIEKKIVKKMGELQIKYNACMFELNKISAFLNFNKYSNKTCNFITEGSFLENERIILGAGPITAHEVNECISEESLYMLVDQYMKFMQSE
jgi:acetylornithine deacetylase/succinyl-diaminopimelate desuccinylase-like protein